MMTTTAASNRAGFASFRRALSVAGGGGGDIGGCTGSTSIRRAPIPALPAAADRYRSLRHHAGLRSFSSAIPTPSSPSTRSQSQPSSPLESYVTGPDTHFGYESVPRSEKAGRVRAVFESVADDYDVMNDLMSAGMHRLWKDDLVKATGAGPAARALRRRAAMDYAGSPGSAPTTPTTTPTVPLLSILDLAGGTGDVAFRFLDAAGSPERSKSSGADEVSVTVCDINPEMLRVGERRARSGERFADGAGPAMMDHSEALRFVEGDAQELPFDDATFDVVTIAFGLRNVTDVDRALRDARRVLKPGGRYMCLEFSRVVHPVLAKMYDDYSFAVIPAVGEMVANDRESYQYLVESIRKFCGQDELKARMEGAGFEECKYTNMTGGIVAMHEGWKPL